MIALPIDVSFDGGPGTDTIRGPPVDATWTVVGAGVGALGSWAFSGVESLEGAADNEDTFVFEAEGGLTDPVDGGDGGFDTVVLGPGTFDSVVYSASGPDSGTISRDGAVITYVGMEPLIDNSDTANRVFTGTAVADEVTVKRTGTQITIESDNDVSTFESVTFNDPTQSLTIKLLFNAEGSDEHVNVEALGDFDAALTIEGGDGPDTVTFKGSTNFLGHTLKVEAETIKVEGNVTLDTTETGGNAGAIELRASRSRSRTVRSCSRRRLRGTTRARSRSRPRTRPTSPRRSPPAGPIMFLDRNAKVTIGNAIGGVTIAGGAIVTAIGQTETSWQDPGDYWNKISEQLPDRDPGTPRDRSQPRHRGHGSGQDREGNVARRAHRRRHEQRERQDHGREQLDCDVHGGQDQLDRPPQPRDRGRRLRQGAYSSATVHLAGTTNTAVGSVEIRATASTDSKVWTKAAANTRSLTEGYTQARQATGGQTDGDVEFAISLRSSSATRSPTRCG